MAAPYDEESVPLLSETHAGIQVNENIASEVKSLPINFAHHATESAQEQQEQNHVRSAGAAQAYYADKEQCLNQVWAEAAGELKQKPQSASTCTCFEAHPYNCCSKNPVISESIKKAHALGVIAIKNIILSNLFSKAIYRELFIYLALFFVLVTTCFSAVHLLMPFFEDTASNHTQSKNKLQIEKNLDYINVSVGVCGLLFFCLDVTLHFRHCDCRAIIRKCKKQELVQRGDEERAEYCNDSCACEGTCGKGCVAFMDITRIIVLETVFYPKALLHAFGFIVHLVRNEYNQEMLTPFEWFSAVVCLCSLLFIYIKRLYILVGVVFSIRKVQSGERNLKGIVFIIIFVCYMCALMVLQFLMIIIICIRFYYEYQDNRVIETSWQLYCMIALTYLMPLFGIFMFFFVHQFWTMKLPVDVIYDLIKVLQTKGKEMQHHSSEKTVATVKKVMEYLGEDFEKDYKELNKVLIWNRLIYPHLSPLHIIVASLYILMFGMFLVCCIIDGPSGTEWLVCHILVTATAIFINGYAASIVLFWPIAIVVVIAKIIAIIVVVIVWINLVANLWPLLLILLILVLLFARYAFRNSFEDMMNKLFHNKLLFPSK